MPRKMRRGPRVYCRDGPRVDGLRIASRAAVDPGTPLCHPECPYVTPYICVSLMHSNFTLCAYVTLGAPVSPRATLCQPERSRRIWGSRDGGFMSEERRFFAIEHDPTGPTQAGSRRWGFH